MMYSMKGKLEKLSFLPGIVCSKWICLIYCRLLFELIYSIEIIFHRIFQIINFYFSFIIAAMKQERSSFIHACIFLLQKTFQFIHGFFSSTVVSGDSTFLFFPPPKCSSKLLQELRQEGACCLGLLCASLSYEAEKIFKWIFSKFSSSTKDEVKLLYLYATYKALETVGEKKAFSSLMQVRLQVKTGMLMFSSAVLE